jgi:hypothetical protein
LKIRGKTLKKAISLAGLSMLLLVAMVASAMAQYDWDVSVEVGDWFSYYYQLSRFEGTVPEYLSSLIDLYNNTHHIKYSVTGVNFPIVNWTVETRWDNGSVTTAALDENITSSTYLMVIGANLTEGTEIRAAGMGLGARTLNASIMLDEMDGYPFYYYGPRETNTLNYSWTMYDTAYDYLFYWDKEYGVQVYNEVNASHPDMGSSSPAYNYTVKFKLWVTNKPPLYTSPDLTGPILLLTIMLITIPIVLLHRRKKQSSKTLSLPFSKEPIST